ncbi:MAG: tRNA1(Val) (adenine(37)-N6)-methyltransferase [Nitrospirae bacterium]|nr:tRNA1(Val) (adenine(37)-N6)-methyltransferase [Nitrospirota bacterium]
MTGLTLDSIKSVRLCQRKAGYRFSIDAVWLDDFVRADNVARCIDLGTGSGIIALLLASRCPEMAITAVEIQPGLAELARKNAALNGFDGRISVIDVDIRQLDQFLQASFADLVVSNPPYKKRGSGRPNPDDERLIARHEIHLSFQELCAAASRLLKIGGTFCVVHLAERLAELFGELRAARLEPKRARFVHPAAGMAAKTVLIEAVKGGKPGLVIEQPLIP